VEVEVEVEEKAVRSPAATSPVFLPRRSVRHSSTDLLHREAGEHEVAAPPTRVAELRFDRARLKKTLSRSSQSPLAKDTTTGGACPEAPGDIPLMIVAIALVTRVECQYSR